MATYEIHYTRRKLSDISPEPLMTPQKAVLYLLDNCYAKDELWREQSYALFLDRTNRVKGHMLLSYGGTTGTAFDLRLIVKGALDSFAEAVILSHNHPSGDSAPSQDDIQNTGKLKQALGVFDMKLIDHIIIGENEIFSFQEERKLKIKTT